MSRTAQIQAKYSDEIDEAADQFGDHEGMNAGRILRWLSQFADEDLPLAIEVLEAIRYLASSNIRAMTKQLFKMIEAELRDRELATAVFVAVGSTASGSAIVVRVLRDLTRGTPHKVLSMLEVSDLSPGEVDAIVFVDDFAGTGRTLATWWENVESIVRPSNAAVFVGVLILNEPARELVEAFAAVLAVTELGIEANVLAKESTLFSDAKKGTLLKYCQVTRCGPRFEKGFGECGLLVGLKHSCPNNSLPILWFDGPSWRPLFNRRAI